MNRENTQELPSRAHLSFSRTSEGDLLIHVSGDWRMGHQVPSVEAEIIRLDGNLGENATLEVQWMVFGLRGSKQLLVTKKLRVTEPTGGQDYQALVSAESRALQALSRDIAEAIKTSHR